jgi:uncharacterized protein YceK
MRIFFIVLLIGLSGCTTAHITTGVGSDGTPTCEASYNSFWKDVEAASLHACNAGGDVNGSSANTDLAAALTGALIRGLGVTQ